LSLALRLVQLHILLLLGKAVIRNTRPSRQTAGSLRGLGMGEDFPSVPPSR